MNSIGDRIAIKRQNKQMTQEEFASRLGVTPHATPFFSIFVGYSRLT